MAAANTDLFKKLARKWVGQIGSGGVADSSTTTVPLLAVTNLPTDTAVVATINRVNAAGTKTPDDEETVIGVVSGTDLINCTRGAEGTAQAHDAGAVVEILITAKGWDDVMDGILVDHDQSGQHSDLTDSGGNEWISQTATASAVNEFTIANAATGNNPSLCATGETNVGVDISLKGTGDFNLADGTNPNITVAGTDPWRTVSIFGSMAPTTTAGCSEKTKVEAGTNDIDYYVLDFATGSDENAFVNFQMPDSWDAGAIQFRYVWTNAAGLTTETVTFELSGRSFADNDAIDQAVGTAIEAADTWIAQGDVHISAWSGDVTLAGTAAAGEWVHFEIMRDVSEDDLTGDARLMDVQIRYKQAQYTD